jgi:hypothetical protein
MPEPRQVVVIAVPMPDQHDGYVIECSACGVTDYVGGALIDLYCRAHLAGHGVATVEGPVQ